VLFECSKVEARVRKVAGHSLFYAFLVLTFLVLVGTSTVLFNYFKVGTSKLVSSGVIL
jgi:hypothetical protein